MSDNLNENVEEAGVSESAILSDEFLVDDDAPVAEEDPVSLPGDEEEDGYMHTFDDRDENY